MAEFDDLFPSSEGIFCDVISPRIVELSDSNFASRILL